MRSRSVLDGELAARSFHAGGRLILIEWGRFPAGALLPMIQASARLLLGAIFALAANLAAAASLPETRRFGIVWLAGDGTGCALVADSSLPIGERIAVIVTGGRRHQLARAVIAGPPLWHRYVYLGYDAVATCTDISAAARRPR